jgi:hypothetical protein
MNMKWTIPIPNYLPSQYPIHPNNWEMRICILRWYFPHCAYLELKTNRRGGIIFHHHITIDREARAKKKLFHWGISIWSKEGVGGRELDPRKCYNEIREKHFS